jgi:hypothetical protein
LNRASLGWLVEGLGGDRESCDEEDEEVVVVVVLCRAKASDLYEGKQADVREESLTSHWWIRQRVKCGEAKVARGVK